MNIKFSTILVPVDFTVNTEVAIKKALILCEGAETSIHLLHVPKMTIRNVVNFYQNYPIYYLKDEDTTIQQAEGKMERLRNYISTIRVDLNIVTWVSYESSIEAAIINKAMAIKADLIVIGKNSHHSWLPFLNTVVPARVAKKTGTAVLTIKPGAINHPIKTVVIPVSKRFPERKIAVIHALRKKLRMHICLVTFLDSSDDPETLPASLLNTYRFFKADSLNNVDLAVLKGNNKAKAILEYCKKVNADLLIVDPESETRIGWLNRHISDVLPVQSKTQILAIHPA